MKIRSISILTILASASLASAGPDDTATAAAQHGRAAWKAGRIHEACEAFEQSDRLAASVEIELHLASCYEQDGRPASAARLYRAVAAKDRAKRASSLAKAAQLEARAPRLHLAIQPMPPGLVVKIDGIEVPASEDAPVDTGPHEIVATAPGYEGHASAPVDRERAVVNVTISMEPRREPAPPPAPAPVVEAQAPARAAAPPPVEPAAPIAADHRKRNGLVVGAGGLGLLVGAAIAFEAASSRFDDAARLCPASTCANDTDLAKGKSLLSDGHTLRGVSIGMGLGGVALLAAGGYLLLASHREETHVSIHVDHSGAGVAYGARF